MEMSISYIDNQNPQTRAEISNKLKEQGIDQTESRAGNKNSLFGKIDGQLAYVNIGSAGDKDANDKFHAQVIDKETGKWRDLKSNEYDAFIESLSSKGAFKDRADILEKSRRSQDATNLRKFGAYTNDLSKISKLSGENRDKVGKDFDKNLNEIKDISEIKDLKEFTDEVDEVKKQLKENNIAWEDNGAEAPPEDKKINQSAPPEDKIESRDEIVTRNQKLIKAYREELNASNMNNNKTVFSQNPLETEAAKILMKNSENKTIEALDKEIEQGIRKQLESSSIGKEQKKEVETILSRFNLGIGKINYQSNLDKYKQATLLLGQYEGKKFFDEHSLNSF
jgi:hypothetical protein